MWDCKTCNHGVAAASNRQTELLVGMKKKE